MPQSSRRQDDLSIDELLSDDYSWNDTDSDYLSFSEHDASGHGSTSGTASGSASDSCSQSIPVPPFSTPPKLKPVEQVMRDNPGTTVASLRQLTTALARDAILGLLHWLLNV